MRLARSCLIFISISSFSSSSSVYNDWNSPSRSSCARDELAWSQHQGSSAGATPPGCGTPVGRGEDEGPQGEGVCVGGCAWGCPPVPPHSASSA